MEIVVSSFYKYIEIKDPIKFQESHLKYCKDLGIKGKILLAEEGINGTISGTEEQIRKYKKDFKKNKLFKDVIFKDTISDSHPFKKTLVRIRNEIVSSGLNVNMKNKADYISPEELNKLIEKEEVVLLDARNNYESKIGKFKNAITPDIETFRDFKKVPKLISKLKDKTIVTYCTGGIRCEKASAFLKASSFNNVLQLHGGIIEYINEFPDKHFEGRCFVFDNRLSIPSGNKTKDITICEICHVPCGRYINCANKKCDNLFVCCEECDIKLKHACSKKCSFK